MYGFCGKFCLKLLRLTFHLLDFVHDCITAFFKKAEPLVHSFQALANSRPST